jgi:hypothetical protein
MSGSVDEDEPFEAVEVKEDVADVGVGITPSGGEPVQVGSPALGRDVAVGRPVVHGVAGVVDALSLDQQPWVDQSRIDPPQPGQQARTDVEHPPGQVVTTDRHLLTGRQPDGSRPDRNAVGFGCRRWCQGNR